MFSNPIDIKGISHDCIFFFSFLMETGPAVFHNTMWNAAEKDIYILNHTSQEVPSDICRLEWHRLQPDTWQRSMHQNCIGFVPFFPLQIDQDYLRQEPARFTSLARVVMPDLYLQWYTNIYRGLHKETVNFASLKVLEGKTVIQRETGNDFLMGTHVLKAQYIHTFPSKGRWVPSLHGIINFINFILH